MEKKMAWEEPEEAFKLFAKAYNARMRKERLEKKARAGTRAKTEIQQAGQK